MINNYFRMENSEVGNVEQTLLNDIVVETIQAFGMDLNYCPRINAKTDKILNESPLAAFTSYFTIEMYVDTYDGFQGNGYMFAQEGLVIDDILNLTVSRERFFQETGMKYPKVGDLIYFPISNAMFEITFVDPDAPFYQLGKNYTFALKCKSFVYSYEQFTTGIKNIDDNFKNDGFIDPIDDSVHINRAALDILDFDEDNPFGEITEEEGFY